MAIVQTMRTGFDLLLNVEHMNTLKIFVEVFVLLSFGTAESITQVDY